MSSNQDQSTTILEPVESPDEKLTSYPIEKDIKQQAHEFVNGFTSPGSYNANSLIITGPRGCGKRNFARKLVGELGKSGLTKHEWLRKLDSELRHDPDGVHEIFAEARQAAPIVLVFDISDIIQHDGQALALRSELRRISDRNDIAAVFVLDEGALWADAVDRIFEAIGMTIELPAPTRSRRRSILQQELDQVMTDQACPIATDGVAVGSTAIKTEGFATDTVRNVVHRTVDQVQRGEYSELTGAALEQTAEQVRAEQHNELQHKLLADLFDAPDTTFADIGGLEQAKREIKKSIQQPQEWRETCERWDVSPAKNILLYGPPGTGKTMLARAAANVTDRSFIPVKAADISQGIDELFEIARSNAPSIIFFDEFDSIGGRRGDISHTSDNVVNSLLSELDGLGEEADVVMIAATNRPHVIDEALLRPGRFGEHIEVPKPCQMTIKKIFEIHIAEVPTDETVTADWFSETVTVETGAEVETICNRAVSIALEGSSQSDPADITVSQSDLRAAAERFITDRIATTRDTADSKTNNSFY